MGRMMKERSVKSGLPPGTLVHIGERRIPPEEVQETLALFDQILDVTGAKEDLMAADVRGEIAAGKDRR